MIIRKLNIFIKFILFTYRYLNFLNSQIKDTFFVADIRSLKFYFNLLQNVVILLY
jgi:hypothetical protein